MPNKRPTTDKQEAQKQDNEQPPLSPQSSVLSPQLVRRLNWTMTRPLASLLGGDERSRQRGAGMELAEVRPYQPGDDVRHIDWSITARTDVPFVREAYAERALDVWFVIDRSASIDWGTARCLKRERAEEFVAIAGQLMGQHGHRLGAVLFAEKLLEITPPNRGRSHVLRLLGRMREAASQGAWGATDLATVLHHTDKILRRRSLIVLVSDFLVPDGWQTPIGRMAQRHEIVAVRLHDPREAELPDVGLITLEDPETGAQMIVNSADKQLRARYNAAAQAQAHAMQAAFNRYGIDMLSLSTADDMLPALLRLLQARRVRRTGGMLRGART